MKSAANAASSKPVKHSHPWRTVIVLDVACALLLFSGYGFWQRYQATHAPQPIPAAAITVAHSTDKPDETPIDTSQTYNVPANQPRRIIMPTIGAEAFVQRVGLDQHGAVAVPSNINLAGWFTAGETPGKPGLSIIDGHVQGRYAPGIFKNLSKLKSGDTFTIEFGDRHVIKFQVVSVNSYATDAVKEHLFAKQSNIASQLNLITCGGSFDSAKQQYTQRLLVVSKPITDNTTNR